METTVLGKTGMEISRIGIGGWQAAGWSTSDDKRFVAVIRRALEKGLNFIDTAEGYGKGHSERLVAQAIDGQRDEIIIASKFSPWNATPEHLQESLEKSLRNLRTDYLDLYQYHWPSPEIPLADTIGEMEALRQQGKIRAIGVSNWMKPEWDEFDNPNRIDSLQPCHSLLWRSIEATVLPLCRQHGIAVLPYSPLCQGALAGRFRKPEDIPKSDPRKANKLWSRERLPEVLKVLDGLQAVAEKYDKTLAQTAIRWLLDQPGITAPVVGASRPEQVDENVGALNWNLADDDWQALSELSRPLSAELSPKDTLWGWHPKYPKKRK